MKQISEKNAKFGIIFLSVIVAVLVGVLNWGLKSRPELDIDLTVFPKLHAVFNSLVAVLLFFGLVFIKQKKIFFHKVSMLSAFILSALFLLSYVFYHTLAEPTSYGGEGFIAYFYYFLLITHIILAALIMPFILMTFFYALTERIEKHRKLAKITWPLWFYVAVTGVVIYFMISPYY